MRVWRKSSYSSPDGNCLEVWSDQARVAVRDSKKLGPVLTFPSSTWRTFTVTARAYR